LRGLFPPLPPGGQWLARAFVTLGLRRPEPTAMLEPSKHDERKADMPLKEGDAAPDFELPTDKGGTVRLSDFKGRPVVLYFYPADDTPGCTTEAIDFTAALPEFEAAGAVVVGVSPDTVESHDRFKAKHGLKVILAADPDHKVSDRYGAWGEKMNYGRKTIGLIRSTVLIGADGRIVRHWPTVRVKGHVAAVLAEAKAL
jgi:thioredoxin-dependent peroxiredoxin